MSLPAAERDGACEGPVLTFFTRLCKVYKYHGSLFVKNMKIIRKHRKKRKSETPFVDTAGFPE